MFFYFLISIKLLKKLMVLNKFFEIFFVIKVLYLLYVIWVFKLFWLLYKKEFIGDWFFVDRNYVGFMYIFDC